MCSKSCGIQEEKRVKKKYLIIIIVLFVYSVVSTILIFSYKNDSIGSSQTLKDYETDYLDVSNEINSLINNNAKLTQDNKNLKEELGKLQEVNKKLNEEIFALNKQMENLENFISIDLTSIEELKHKGINDYHLITEDLLLHPELISYEGVLGGTMFFYKAFVLNDHWVYATFEDGHITGSGIYEFSIGKDLKITWREIAAFIAGEND